MRDKKLRDELRNRLVKMGDGKQKRYWNEFIYGIKMLIQEHKACLNLWDQFKLIQKLKKNIKAVIKQNERALKK